MDKAEGLNIWKAISCWLITAGYMVTIYYLSSHHGLVLPGLPKNFDKVVHIVLYAPLAFLFYLSLKKSGVRNYLFFVAFLAAALYGVTDEIHQFFVVGRDATIGDTIADIIGALIGSFGGTFLKT